ncbi:Testis-expressed sequence 38 protein [Sciurus carolinensis]|uniref:Testis-expressed sequence 38 protein n=1 Tax=Sciurus carolinensis TaxID=30640 RepID=A0AA41NHU6_SCICA|nr:Testis-expressed sequence 38 protein [Sciurus carolinensis]
MDGRMSQLKERNEKQLRSQPELSVSCLFSFLYCLSLGLTILWTHGTGLRSNWQLHLMYSLQEEVATGEACPAVAGSDERFHFIYSPLLYWINMEKRHSINATIQIGPPTAVTISEMKDHIPDCLWESHTPEAKGYGLRGSMCRAEIPGGMQADLVVSGQPVSNRMPQRHTTPPFLIPIFLSGDILCPTHPQNASHVETYCLLRVGTSILKGISTTIPFPHSPWSELFQCQDLASYL